MSHNSLYADIYFMIMQLIKQHIARLLSTRTHRRIEAGLPPEPSIDLHDYLYDSIIRGDIEAARRAQEEVLGIIPQEGVDVFNEDCY